MGRVLGGPVHRVQPHAQAAGPFQEPPRNRRSAAAQESEPGEVGRVLLTAAEDRVDDGGDGHAAGRAVPDEHPRHLGAVGRVAQDRGSAGEDGHDYAVEEPGGVAEG